MSLIAHRSGPRITHMFAVVIWRDGQEGVVRRDTPYGTQPWITEDADLVAPMLAMARGASGFADAYVVRFTRDTDA